MRRRPSPARWAVASPAAATLSMPTWSYGVRRVPMRSPSSTHGVWSARWAGSAGRCGGAAAGGAGGVVGRGAAAEGGGAVRGGGGRGGGRGGDARRGGAGGDATPAGWGAAAAVARRALGGEAPAGRGEARQGRA